MSVARLVVSAFGALIVAGLHGPPAAHAQARTVDTLACVDPATLAAGSAAIRRNLAALAVSDLCVSEDRFEESTGNLKWQLVVIRHRSQPHRVFWAVPHDNEVAAFDSAVFAVKHYGGTVVAVQAGGERDHMGQDPNRNFDLGAAQTSKCPRQLGRSPVYTERFLHTWNRKVPVVALHTNKLGWEGSESVSMLKPSKVLVPYPAASALGNSPNDTVVYVPSFGRNLSDQLRTRVTHLTERGVNVLHERVELAQQDCSLSNYLVLKGFTDFVNIDVTENDGETQKHIISIVIGMFAVSSLP